MRGVSNPSVLGGTPDSVALAIGPQVLVLAVDVTQFLITHEIAVPAPL
jgi:hypothetical protein